MRPVLHTRADRSRPRRPRVSITPRPMWRLRWARWLLLAVLRSLVVAGVLTAIHLAFAVNGRDFATHRLDRPPARPPVLDTRLRSEKPNTTKER